MPEYLSPVSSVRDREFLFQVGHSAPDIYGQRIANPIAAIWAGAMMLDFLGEKKAHDLIMDGIGKTLESKQQLTRDLGGQAHTDEMSNDICANIRQFKS